MLCQSASLHRNVQQRIAGLAGGFSAGNFGERFLREVSGEVSGELFGGFLQNSPEYSPASFW
jgi:hypothetical protein